MNRAKTKTDEERPSNLDTRSSNLKKEDITSPFDSGTGMSMSDLGSSELDLQSEKSKLLSTELKKTGDSKLFSSTTIDSGYLDSGFDVKDECETPETNLESIWEAPHQALQFVPKNFNFYDYQDTDGDTPLHLAVIQAEYEIAFQLIANCPFYLNVLNNLYQSAMHLAILAQQPRLVRRLVIAGALLDLQDFKGNTAFHLACSIGNYECLRALTVPAISTEIEQSELQYEPANGLYKFRPEVTQIRNYEGQTCVHLAAHSGHKVLEYLIKCGVDVNVKDGKSGQTALHIGVQTQQPSVVNLLCSRSALDVKNYGGRTPMDLARMIERYKPGDNTAGAIVKAMSREMMRRMEEASGGLESQGEEIYEEESDSEYDESDDEED